MWLESKNALPITKNRRKKAPELFIKHLRITSCAIVRINIEFEKSNLILYLGEIYPTNDGGLDYRINDEMILAFEKKTDAETFERKVNCG